MEELGTEPPQIASRQKYPKRSRLQNQQAGTGAIPSWVTAAGILQSILTEKKQKKKKKIIRNKLAGALLFHTQTQAETEILTQFLLKPLIQEVAVSK